MTNSPKPTIVLVHGVWHSPLSYIKLSSALQRAGYDTHVPYMPSCIGAHPPIAGAAEDALLVHRLLDMLADQGRHIVVVMHSYGGVVGCNAVEGLNMSTRKAQGKPGGVVQLIGLAAHIHPTGFGVLDLVREMGNADLIPTVMDIADDGTCGPMTPEALLSDGNSMPEEAEVKEFLCTLSRANAMCLENKVKYEAWRHFPLTYVNTRRDHTLPPHYQQRILEKIANAGFPAEVVEIETGHSPFITAVDEVVKIIEDVSKKVSA